MLETKLPKPITQKDLKAFKKEMIEDVRSELGAFVDAWIEAGNASQSEEPCNCPDCKAQEAGDDMPEPPARYLVQTTQGPVWCNMHKNTGYGIAVFQIIKIAGKDRNVLGHITPEFATFDFRTMVTPEQFAGMSDKDLVEVIQLHEKVSEGKVPDLANYG